MRHAWLPPAVLAALLGSAAWLASTLSGTPLVGYDDANVFFVYARNLINGHGFVFNAGGERVEGFTSLLWLLICSAARAITPRFEILLFAINVAVVSVALWWLHRFISDHLRSKVLSFLLVAAVALTPGFVVWNVVSLMDAGLWSALLAIAAVTVLQSGRGLPVLLVLLVLTRPEAMLWGPALIAASMLIRPSLTMHLPAIAAFSVTAAALFAWRLIYFGFPLPNTHYARVEETSTRIAAGFDYFSDFAIANPLVPVALVAAVAAMRVTHRDALFRVQSALLLLMVVACVIPILEGGDRFGFWRMLQPAALLAAIQVALTIRTMGRAAAIAVLLLALVPWRHWTALDELEYPSITTARGMWYTPRVEISIAEDMRGIGAAFTRAFPDVKPSVGVIVAGGFALAYDGPTIDLMGHNLVAMAHAPGSRIGPRAEAVFQREVFIALMPDALLLSRWSLQRDWFGFPMLPGNYDRPAHLEEGYFQRRAMSMELFDLGVLKGMLFHSDIGTHYAWASVRPHASAPWLHAVFNREFLKRIEGRGYEVVFATPPR